MSRYDPNRPPDYGRDYDYYDDGPDPEEIRYRQAVVYGRIASVVWFITFVILSIILLRVVMLLINANEENSFVRWIYNTSEFFVRPFLGITTDPTLNGIVFEVNSLIAMLIYILLIYGILQLVKVVLDITMPAEP
jgi:uncharacterized protein YggT (Ycf19 family)